MILKEVYRKNKDDIKGVLLGNYPDFVFRKKAKLEFGKIPVFVFHSVTADKFEKQLRYLADNGYKTINADCFYEVLTGSKKPQENTIVLTFDDGLGSLWTVAYPLLKKYGFTGISFLIPSFIKEDYGNYPNLEDVWQGRFSVEKISSREESLPLCSWAEVDKMHESGIIDFQSHSHFHCSVFISDKLVDFVNPAFEPSLLKNSLNPLILKDGKETLPGKVDLGFPIYEWDANLGAESRYIESEMVSTSCMEFVNNNGGKDFFNKPNWRVQLKNYWEDSRSKYEETKKFQTVEERQNDIRKDLAESKKEIERKLDKDVKHLCYPWYKGNLYSVHISKEAGYESNYWGLIKNRAINIIGDNPFFVRRINEQFIFSLPGEGRKPLYNIMGNKVLSLMKN
jgi:peptidoglycan/xylan/chitin deacetylase (PgdA/CDA1 family)